jgi:membrane protease YdiL (CAAX protease family)
MSALLFYLLGAFTYTWAFHSQIVRRRLAVDSAIGLRLYVAGLPGPALAAVAVALANGTTDKLIAGYLRWPVGLQWWLLALLTVPAIYLGATFIHRLLTGKLSTPLFHRPSQGWRMLLLGQLYVVNSEEVGWRGFALPLLITHFGSLGGTLILGPIWALWHLPMFRVSDSNQQGSFLRFAYVLTASSVIMTVTYTGSGGSILPAMLFHAAVNVMNFVMNIPPEVDRIIEIIYLLVALALLPLLLTPLIAVNP